jgi:S-adenosylmethionine/arginine decarboxylase-like enzyme
MALHNHVLINGYTLLPPTNEKQTIVWMQQLVDSIGMKTIQGPFASYVTKEGNRGLTAIVMIETSHIAMHVWDETDPGFIQFDLYTCSTLPVEKIIKNLEDHFGLFNHSVLVLERSDGFKIIPEEKWDTLV